MDPMCMEVPLQQAGLKTLFMVTQSIGIQHGYTLHHRDCVVDVCVHLVALHVVCTFHYLPFVQYSACKQGFMTLKGCRYTCTYIVRYCVKYGFWKQYRPWPWALSGE